MVNFINVSHERVGSRPTKWLSTRASGEESLKPYAPPDNDRTDDDDDDADNDDADDDDDAPVKHFSITLFIFFI